MIDQFLASGDVELLTALHFRETPKSFPTHFAVIEQLTNKKMLPQIYLDLLTSLETDEDRSLLSKKILRIYLYAATKLKEKTKLYNWLLKGTLPQATSQGESMSLLVQKAKKINSLGKNRNKTIDSLTKNRQKMQTKTNKRLEDSVSKNQEKLNNIENQYTTQKDILENIISEIESSLASGQKL
jgi:hypothetical protein